MLDAVGFALAPGNDLDQPERPGVNCLAINTAREASQAALELGVTGCPLVPNMLALP